MKKFIYPMQNILNLKQKLETQEELLFQTAMNALNEEREKLRSLEFRKIEYEDRMRKNISERLDLLTIQTDKEAIEAMTYLIHQQKNVVRKAEHQAELARKRLEEAIKERKIQEKLRENAWNEYTVAFEKEERKEIDELVSYRYSVKDGRTG